MQSFTLCHGVVTRIRAQQFLIFFWFFQRVLINFRGETHVQIRVFDRISPCLSLSWSLGKFFDSGLPNLVRGSVVSRSWSFFCWLSAPNWELTLPYFLNIFIVYSIIFIIFKLYWLITKLNSMWWFKLIFMIRFD